MRATELEHAKPRIVEIKELDDDFSFAIWFRLIEIRRQFKW